MCIAKDDSGATTLDWVVLTAGLVGIAIGVVAVFDDELDAMLADMGGAEEVAVTTTERGTPSEEPRAPSTLFRPDAPEIAIPADDPLATMPERRALRSDQGQGAFEKELAEPAMPYDPAGASLALEPGDVESATSGIRGVDTRCLRDSWEAAAETEAGWLDAIASDDGCAVD